MALDDMLLWNVSLVHLEVQYLMKRYSSVFYDTWEYLFTIAMQKIIKQWKYKINRHVLMCCMLANAR